MKRTLLFASWFWNFCLAASLGYAAAIYDNGPPSSSTDPNPIDWSGSEITHWIQSDNFVLANPSRLETLSFWDFEKPGFFTGSILWQIYSDNGSGIPGNLLLSGTSRNVNHSATTLIAGGGWPEYFTTFDLGPISLPAGNYWLALHNGDLSHGLTGDYPDWSFFWEFTQNRSGPPDREKKAPYAGAWVAPYSVDLAFRLGGVAAPAPPAFTLGSDTAQISFTTTIGYFYRVEYLDRLSNGAWTPLPGADHIAGTGGIVEVTDSQVENQSSRFYRVAVVYDGAGIPVIFSFALANRSPQISFTTAAGYIYRVEYKNELSDPSWTAVSGAESVTGTGNVMQVTDADPNLAAHQRRFYRVIMP